MMRSYAPASPNALPFSTSVREMISTRATRASAGATASAMTGRVYFLLPVANSHNLRIVDFEQGSELIVIMGDDVGWFNVGAYHRGIMSGKTPNLDKLASQGMMFTDYYAEASCTAGRANFITGELRSSNRLDDSRPSWSRRRDAGSGGHNR